MFALSATNRYYIFNRPTDMRKSFDALSGIISTLMNRNPLSGEVFIFINRGKNRIKLLHWQTNGFVLYYKRLEKGTFTMQICQENAISQNITWIDLMMLIEGIEVRNVIRKKRFALGL